MLVMVCVYVCVCARVHRMSRPEWRVLRLFAWLTAACTCASVLTQSYQRNAKGAVAERASKPSINKCVYAASALTLKLRNNL